MRARVCVCAHVCMHVSVSVHVPVTFVSLKQAHSIIAPKVTFTALSVSKVMPVAALLFLWNRAVSGISKARIH